MQKFRELAEEAIEKSEGDFSEIHLSNTLSSTIVQAGLFSNNNGPVQHFSGTARVFVDGRWGLYQFDSPRQMNHALDKAASLAIHSNSPKISFPKVPVACRDTYSSDDVGIPLSDVSLREKTFICRHYCDLMGASLPNGSAKISYSELIKDKVIVNSTGTSIREIENLGSLKKQGRLPSGVSTTEEMAVRGTFDRFKGQEHHIEELGKALLQRDTSTNIASGVYRVILDPELTGILVHEAFGHLVEASFLGQNPVMAHLLRQGAKVGAECVNIIDDTLRMSYPGSMKWDDEGTPCEKTQLITAGKITSWLHTMETASQFGTINTGNARISSIGRTPEARMTCTYMEPGKTPLDQLFSSLDDGLYLKGFMGGATDMDRFSITASEAWIVKKGIITVPVTPVVISGKVADILKSITNVCDDLLLKGSIAGCSKRGGKPIPVTYGGPHILIPKMQVS